MKKLFLVIVFMGLSGQALALGPLHLEGYGSAGLGKSEFANDSDGPKMGAYELGGTVGFNFIPMFYAGLSGQFQVFNQYSSTGTYGNRKGSRFGLSPALGFSFLFVDLKYEYKLWGDYSLSKNSASGAEVKYTDPSGHRLSAQMSVFPLISAGVYFESLKFSKVEEGGTETDLGSNELTLNHYGVMVSIQI